MNRFFEFSKAQLKVILFLVIILVIAAVFKFIQGYSEVDEHSLKFNFSVGDEDQRYFAPFSVDLNRTPADSLELLPGIGPVLSSRIIAFRDSIGFEKPEDIIKINGIGLATYEKLKPYIKVEMW
jgi:DNA uptake protein ComE-like DNA-binding protein